jgi:cell division protein FtsZ
LLEAGAIDGARGILINITGSSSLKLSEVNEASSLIQAAAHEDANIIFGAVLDEKMGDEVKITVIATGFRDQMPERRARMLNVAEDPIVSIPLAAAPIPSVLLAPPLSPSVPLEPAPIPSIQSVPTPIPSVPYEPAPSTSVPFVPFEPAPSPAVPLAPAPIVSPPVAARDHWYTEPAPAPLLQPMPRRFLSQDEEEERESPSSKEQEEPASYSSAPSATPSDPAERSASLQPERTLSASEWMETASEPARPKFAELSEEPEYTLLPRDYAAENTGEPAEADEYSVPPAATLFRKDEDEKRDLDKPAFLRRLGF